ncbi:MULTISPECIES: hypothetical protein [Vibrio]|uniref:hypothetical protein n=1 Tax=Vibrio TaxID=662 RepID=UPI002075DB40|nr:MULTISPECIES: hypothetical protein [Vibrio]USD34806.1 hypothetical protein J8Z27_15880 [Vibrio sp. SCSIO 43186]USD47871.1 hypothetical protein J4N38_16270 [Vibrio sp. SCSIO 43145]USD71929.1 hypothetical protein J4N41_15890 [Vibrio sp. SCSIO 43139]USD97594.1 hypothetical protein CTT30_16085 [Vibrio coralliilyticus]
MRKATRFSILVIGVVLASMVYALPVPEGDPILWVSGDITQSNTADGVEFDSAMIKQLEHGVIKTSNHVVSNVVEYQGPTLSALLDYVGAQGSTVKVIAWDEYVVSIPVSDIKKYGVLLATHEDGTKMTIDDKGPFFVVFPFTDHPEIQTDLFYSLSVWQVREIVIE